MIWLSAQNRLELFQKFISWKNEFSRFCLFEFGAKEVVRPEQNRKMKAVNIPRNIRNEIASHLWSTFRFAFSQIELNYNLKRTRRATASICICGFVCNCNDDNNIAFALLNLQQYLAWLIRISCKISKSVWCVHLLSTITERTICNKSQP